MNILAIDPGSTETAFVHYAYDRRTILDKAKIDNASMLRLLVQKQMAYSRVVIESIACYGMAVGAEVFETVHWAGRFYQAAVEAGEVEPVRMFRREVKLHLCNTVKAKDANVRQVLIDRFGGKDAAIGNVKRPGPLHGVKADVWAALAIAVTYADKQFNEGSAGQ